MKKFFLSVLSLLLAAGLEAGTPKPLQQQKWGHVCRGEMPAEWYGSLEARGIADIVLDVQKQNGGWMKNDQMHKLSEEDYNRLLTERGSHACLDNYATTQEMRYLARVWKALTQQTAADDTTAEKYRRAFLRGMNYILRAQKDCGGWSQYWPLSGGGSYQDYITFNDDLMTNVMLMLRDIYEGKGIFEGLASEEDKQRCREAFDKGLKCILACQIDDNGKKSVWCAQHDVVAPYYATEGRPHELPSYSCAESATLLSFLMSVENPSKELQASIEAAVAWLKAHQINDKAVEDYTNAQGEPDRRIVDQLGSALWPRFMQIGGKVAKPTYELFFKHLEARNKTRRVVYQGKVYNYSEAQNARESYDPKRAYQPIYGIYKDSLQNLYYRFLYNYDDSPIIQDKQGVPQRTSLMAVNRAKYQFVGDWPYRVIYGQYLPWKQKVTAKGEWLEVGKDLKMSNHHIQLPEGKVARKVYVYGFAKGDQDVVVNEQYVFPKKGYQPVYKEYTIDLPEGVKDDLPLTVTGGKGSFVIRVLCE